MINLGIQYRLENQPDLEECIFKLGAAVDTEACLGITAFCWVNGMDLKTLSFDIYKDMESQE